MVTLRPATAADLPFLENLRRKTMRRVVENHRSWNNAEQRKRILLHLDCARIIVRDGQDIGLWKVVRNATEIELCQIQIDPAHQGNGIGTRLIRELQAEADRLGVQITLHVYRSNPALALYRRLGFGIASEDAESLRMAYRPSQTLPVPADNLAFESFPAAAVRRFEATEWPVYRDLRLRALSDSPDAFGSTLDAEQARTDQEWAQRLQFGTSSPLDLPLLALADDQPAGLAWAKVDQGEAQRVNLYQMWVASEFRGRGLGRMLLRTAIAWARGAKEMRLGVTVNNGPAMQLYLRAGFKPEGPAGPIRPGSDLRSQPMMLGLVPFQT